MRKLLLKASLACALQAALWVGLPTTASAVPIRFDYTGSFTSYTVATTGTYQIFTFGAQGGSSSSGAGSLGAEIGGDVLLTSGQMLTIAVGGMGGAGDAFVTGGGGGGGGTFVAISGVPLVIAGGGGGSSSNRSTGTSGGQAGTSGGAGFNNAQVGAPAPGGTAGTGGSTTVGTTSAGGGGGGFSTGGASAGGSYSGTGGASFASGSGGGAAGPYGGAGGFGGGGGGGAFGGAGGGGGYSGGGGGFLGNGGGGGSYFAGLVNNDRVLLSGVNAGNGFATLELLAPVIAPVPEPSTVALLALGLAGVGFAMRRRTRDAA